MMNARSVMRAVMVAGVVVAFAAGTAQARIRISIGHRDDAVLKSIKKDASWIMHKEHHGNFRKWSSFYDDKRHLFSFNVIGCADSAHHDRPVAKVPTLWGGPGWGAHGFIDLREVGGGSLLEHAEPTVTKLAEGFNGEARIVYDAPEATVQIVLRANELDDKFFLSIEIEPNKPLRGYQVRLLGYPSWPGRFKTPEGKDRTLRDRFITTPTRTVAHRKEPVTLDVRREPWVLCGDRLWDGSATACKELPRHAYKDRRGVGPCGVLFPPGQPSTATVFVHNYDVRVEFTYTGQTRRIDYVLWQNFRDKDNAQALDYLKRLKFIPAE